MKICLRALVLLLLSSLSTTAQELHISPKEALEIGNKVWTNEAGHTVKALTHWNTGEDFASLGIGHFIWYPKDKKGPFIESFPELLAFFEKNGAKLPRWLRETKYCPWNSKEKFFKDFYSPRMLQLRRLLSDQDNIALQARFMAARLEASLPKMLEQAPEANRDDIRKQFYRVAQSTGGIYAIMDYVNFKGEGTSPTERYPDPQHGNAVEGWGLLQVLEGMTGKDPGQPALDEFAESAKKALSRRVKNSPPERNEARWLPIWESRIETYRVVTK